VSRPNDGLGFLITYSSLQDLSQEHAQYLVRGGIVIPWSEALPPSGAEVLVRLAVPGGASYDLKGKVSKTVEGKGFTVHFDPSAHPILGTIKLLIESPGFQQALAAESPEKKGTRLISKIGEPERPRAPTPVPAPRSASSSSAAPEDAYDDDDYEDQDDEQEDEDAEEIEDGDDPGTQKSDDDQAKPTNFKTPGPGESFIVYVAKFATLTDYLEVLETFTNKATITLPSVNDKAKEGGLAQLRLTLPGRNIFTMYAIVDKVSPDSVVIRVSADSQAYQAACAFPKTHSGLKRLQSERPDMRKPVEIIRMEEERSADDPDSMPLRRRIQRMSMDDKINLALSGTREERMALAMDGNKSIHHYLLKNARISLDEIAFIARLPTMNPDVLAKIGENPAYTQNPTVLKNLVYNPKTPVALAVRLLDRLPRSEILNLSKRMSMNAKLVQAAKKKIEGRK
jgi:hypothetical protein